MQNVGKKVFAPENGGDFLLKTKKEDVILEVGGSNKDFKQVGRMQNSYLVLDNIEIAEKRKIPLYLFGFLY